MRYEAWVPRISVLMPFRNAEATIAHALQSIIHHQGIDDLEVIAVDDASTDRSRAAAQRALDGHAAARVVANTGRGIADALNCGLRLATAPWIARMDADDMARPHRLIAQLALLERDATLGAVGTQIDVVPPERVTEGMRRYVDWQNSVVTPEEFEHNLFVECPLCHPSVMLRRDALEGVGGWRRFDGPEDYDLWLRLHEAGWRFAKVRKPLFLWSLSASQATFADARYAPERFLEVRALYLARELKRRGGPVALWGAGRGGKRLARALQQHGVQPTTFVDIDPRKIGRTRYGAPVVGADEARTLQGTIVVCVGSWGARDEILARLAAAGKVRGRDFICAA